ncbi:MAG: UDP-N-acetylmuramate dehydrogenase [Planctomycetes bacterium]|nr:UDP-N-acetylmuramate dehydrogenase [Planctomycetota bacterium]
MSWRARYAEILDEDRSLAELTTWKIGGRARSFLMPRSEAEALALQADLAAAGVTPLILGGGANLLIDDAEHERPIIHLGALAAIEEEGDCLRVQAGHPFLRLVAEAARVGRSGLEGLAGIPGQMGGICRMNAGGRWGEIKDLIEQVVVATPAGERLILARDECGFGYRRSAIDGLIMAVVLRLGRGDPDRLRASAAEHLRIKAAAQPLKLPSGGCCFANPAEISAGRLVDELGLKGERRGDAQISEQHGNFIVNLGRARFAEVMELIELIEREALDRRGIRLRREIGIWRGPAACG